MYDTQLLFQDLNRSNNNHIKKALESDSDEKYEP